MNWPGFRFGSLNGYLNAEINGLISQGHEVLLVIGDGLELEAKQKGFKLDKLNYKTIRQKHLRKIFCDYHKASMSWYKNEYTEEQLQSMVTLIHNVLDGYVPDVIMTWESPIPFMSVAFPDALVVYENYGAISRHPFPTTQAIDIFGLFKNSYIAQLKSNLESGDILIPDLTKKQSYNLSKIREKIKKSLNLSNPFANYALHNNGFKYVALVPLQVSGYYAFDGNVPYKSQFDYLCHILDNMSSDVLVVVTEHTSYPSIFTPRTLNYLRKRYSNFYWHEELNEVKGASQYLLPLVDFVVGTTSSVLLQAVILDIPVKVIGDSHVSIFSSPHGLHRAERIVNRHHKNSFDKIIYHLITKYWHNQEEKVHNGAWLSNYLDNTLNKFRNNKLNINFYLDYKLDEERVIKDILNGISVSDPIIINKKAPQKSNKLKLPSLHEIECNHRQLIDSAEWVSFDIFDTLVQRATRTPKDIFIYVGLAMEKIIGLEPRVFASLRVKAEKTVRDNSIYEEVTIFEIYNEIISELNLSYDIVQKLVNIELEAEVSFSLPRKAGIELLSYAKKMGKKVYLISDMYLEKSHIIEIIKKHNINIPAEDIYVSSNFRLQKHSGNLFKKFISDTKVKSESGLHIGDNPTGDVKSAELNGIKSLHIPKAYDLFKGNVFFHKEISNKSSFNSSLYSGLLISKLYDNSLTRADGVTCGSKYLLGYSVIGPLLVSFSQWLEKKCIDNGIDDIYFLARDGKVFKKAFDKTCSNLNLSTHYLYASRRSINLPSITTKAQIKEIMMAPFNPCTLGYLIKNRLGLTPESIDPAVAKKFNFEKVVTRNDHDIARFIDAAESRIINNATAEREALDVYLKSKITHNKKIAIVDIGYKGSMQQSLSNLVDNKILGYYLVTTDEIGKLPSEGFLENRVNKAGSSPFWQGVALAEWLTLDGDTSVEKFTVLDGKAEPCFKQKQAHDISRQLITKHIHEGAFDFVDDWTIHSSTYDEIDLSCVKHNYYSLLATPSLTDIKLFEETQLEDSYGGRDDRWLVGPLKQHITDKELQNLHKSYSWKGAVSMLNKIYTLQHTKTPITNTSETISGNSRIRKFMVIKKIKKFTKSPTRFLIDSQFSLLKIIGKKINNFKIKREFRL